jgi:serine/threonine protein kinase
MELCDTYSLQDLITRRSHLAASKGAKTGYQGLSELEVRYFMIQLIEALTYLHSQ